MLLNYRNWKKLNEQEDFDLSGIDDLGTFSKDDIIDAIKNTDRSYITGGPDIQEESDDRLIITFEHGPNYHGISDIEMTLTFTSEMGEGFDSELMSNMGLGRWSFSSASIAYQHKSPEFEWDKDSTDPRSDAFSDDHIFPEDTEEAEEYNWERFDVQADWIGGPIETINDLKGLIESYQNMQVVVKIPSGDVETEYNDKWGVAKNPEWISKSTEKLKSRSDDAKKLAIDAYKTVLANKDKYSPEFMEQFKKQLGIKDHDLED
jgi:hypothetical protein